MKLKLLVSRGIYWGHIGDNGKSNGNYCNGVIQALGFRGPLEVYFGLPCIETPA